MQWAGWAGLGAPGGGVGPKHQASINIKVHRALRQAVREQTLNLITLLRAAVNPLTHTNVHWHTHTRVHTHKHKRKQARAHGSNSAPSLMVLRGEIFSTARR